MGRLHHKSSVRDSIVNTLIPGVAVSGLTGLAVGVCVFFYKWGADALHRISDQLYESVRAHLVYLPLFLLGLIALACLMNLIIKWEPSVAGGGIARAEGVMRGLFPIRSLPTFFGAIGASMTGFFAGLPLGSEGPSVLIGTSLGGMFNRLAPGKRAWRRYTLTAGGAAGFAVATGAPLAGVLFALEETHRKFSPMILLVATSGVLCASIANVALGLTFKVDVTLIHFGTVASLPFSAIWIPAVVGIVTGVAAGLFNRIALAVGTINAKQLGRISGFIKLPILFAAVGLIGLFVKEARGSGSRLIETLASQAFPWYLLLALLALRGVLVLVSSSSGASGGMFIPTLVIGALIGALTAELLILAGVDPAYRSMILVFAVCGFLGGCMRAPVTAIVFTLEVTANLTGFNLLYVVIVSFFSYTATQFVCSESLSEVLLSRMLRSRDGEKTPEILCCDLTVQAHSFVVGKAVRDLLMPPNSLIGRIAREGKDVRQGKMVKSGDKKLHAGDRLSVQVQTYDRTETEQELTALFGNQKVEFRELNDRTE